ncbi:MAG TPA: NifU family protein [Terriglobales bacterium]|nr:NifU family protein [Terriglobales bacterium]
MRESEVQRALDRVRHAMQADGGDVELVSVEGGIVSVRLRGSCLVCPSASLTMKLGLERTLLGSIPWVTSVIRIP